MPSPSVTNLNPEQRARVQIDAMLTASGWIVQDYRSADFTAGLTMLLEELNETLAA